MGRWEGGVAVVRPFYRFRLGSAEVVVVSIIGTEGCH